MSSIRESRHICLHRPKCLCKIAQDWLSVTHVLTGFSVGSNIYWRPPCWNEQGSKVQREDTRRLASFTVHTGKAACLAQSLNTLTLFNSPVTSVYVGGNKGYGQLWIKGIIFSYNNWIGFIYILFYKVNFLCVTHRFLCIDWR